MPSLLVLSTLFLAIVSSNSPSHVGALSLLCPKITAHPSSRRTLLSLSGSNGWWDGVSNTRWWDGDNRDASSDKKQTQPSFITREMEEEVMASARSKVDENTVLRALSSIIDDRGDTNINSNNNRSRGRGDRPKKTSKDNNRNTLRDLSLSTVGESVVERRSYIEGNKVVNGSTNSGDTHQIAIASGLSAFFLSPLVVPIVHSILPPIIPSPSSVSFTGAALLGAISYIVALGDPTKKSNVISDGAGSVLGDGVEVGGAVSRIVGRTALKSVETSAPRLRAAARAMVDYESAATALEDMQQMQRQLLKLEAKNYILRKEVALWQAVEDVSNMYKLEELKEMAKYEGLKGYSSDGKNALLRRLVKEGILKLDLDPYC